MLVRFLLVHVSTGVLAVLILLISIGLSLVGLVIARRLIDVNKQKEHQDVAGFLIAVVGVIYAVLLAFVVVIVWEDFGNADTTASNEAAAVGNLYRDAVAAGGPQGLALEQSVRTYAQSVVTEDWPEVAKHQKGSVDTDMKLDQVWRDVRDLDPAQGSGIQQAFATQAVADVSTATEARRTRILESTSGIPTPLWAVLIVGGIITVAFSYLFAVERLWAHAVMVTALAALIGLSVLVILTLNLPYTGSVSVRPEAMQIELDSAKPNMF